ncbi:MAG: hypothetical protein CM1200mP35_04380 [Chloroflexota bacterium]|nr:MAG: hypothetical protein CM1200mP35_04380 [Chloroflexota bacterium]
MSPVSWLKLYCKGFSPPNIEACRYSRPFRGTVYPGTRYRGSVFPHSSCHSPSHKSKSTTDKRRFYFLPYPVDLAWITAGNTPPKVNMGQLSSATGKDPCTHRLTGMKKPLGIPDKACPMASFPANLEFGPSGPYAETGCVHKFRD